MGFLWNLLESLLVSQTKLKVLSFPRNTTNLSRSISKHCNRKIQQSEATRKTKEIDASEKWAFKLHFHLRSSLSLQFDPNFSKKNGRCFLATNKKSESDRDSKRRQEASEDEESEKQQQQQQQQRRGRYQPTSITEEEPFEESEWKPNVQESPSLIWWIFPLTCAALAIWQYFRWIKKEKLLNQRQERINSKAIPIDVLLKQLLQ